VTIDVVPRYLSCGIKLLTKCMESLITSVHKISICAPSHPPPRGSLISRLPICCRQTLAGVSCGSRMWVKVRAGLSKKFIGGYQEQVVLSHKYLNNCLRNLMLDNALR